MTCDCRFAFEMSGMNDVERAQDLCFDENHDRDESRQRVV